TLASQAGYPSSLIHGDPREIQPRIGYAWRPLTKGSLVIRGGYGIYYNTSVYQALVSQMSQQSPLSYSLIDSATQAPLTLVNTIANNLWLQLQRRFRGGFSGNLAYAHANSIDNGAAGGGGRGGGGGGARVVAQNWQDLDSERARTSGIRTHTLSAMAQFSTGMGARGGALTKGVKGKFLRD